MPLIIRPNYKGVCKQAPWHFWSISVVPPQWMSCYVEEQQGMDSWQKNAGWLFGTLEEHIQKKGLEMKGLRIRQMQAKGSHLSCKWDQMKGSTGQPHRGGWVQQQIIWHDELSTAKTNTKWISDGASNAHFHFFATLCRWKWLLPESCYNQVYLIVVYMGGGGGSIKKSFRETLKNLK